MINKIPRTILKGLENYIYYGIPFGHFLTSIFENNLKESINRADDECQSCLIDIVKFIHNYIPIKALNIKDWLSMDINERKEFLKKCELHSDFVSYHKNLVLDEIKRMSGELSVCVNDEDIEKIYQQSLEHPELSIENLIEIEGDKSYDRRKD